MRFRPSTMALTFRLKRASGCTIDLKNDPGAPLYRYSFVREPAETPGASHEPAI